MTSQFQIDLRKASSVEHGLPYRAKTVAFLRISTADGSIVQAKTVSEKRRMLAAVRPDDVVLAAWPGQYSQDVFLLDDLDAARAEL